MDEQQTNSEEFDILKSLENDHITDSLFSLDLDSTPEIDLDKTQVFSSEDFQLPLNDTPETDLEPIPQEESPVSPAKKAPQRKAPAKKSSSLIRKESMNDPRYQREVLLPLGILALAAVLCVVFVIGSLSHVLKTKKELKEASIAASSSQKAEEDRLTAEAESVLAQAAAAANGMDFSGAIAIIDSFEGDPAKYGLSDARAYYQQELESTTVWSDPSQVLNLSFHTLIADPARAYADDDFGYSYETNFISTSEFSKMLEQLYANDYILVNLTDLVEITIAQDMNTYSAKALYLPAGKKPLILTQTNANYYTYMIDGDDDGKPDKDGAGFASKLIVDANGNLVNEMVDANGNTVTGAFDMVPILEQFIAEHPDFSYRNARAVIAPSGYDGVFGYRIQASAEESLGAEAYAAEVAGAKKVADTLRQKGYIIGCYSYNNDDFGDATAAAIQMDLMSWDEEIAPVIGQTDVMVFARNSDIGGIDAYSGEKYTVLRDFGYHYFLGVGDQDMWAMVSDSYLHQFRLLVTGERLEDSPERYNGIFDAASIMNDQR